MDPMGTTSLVSAARPKKGDPGNHHDEEASRRLLCDLLVERVRDYAIFILGVDGTVRSWNEGAERIKGYTKDEILGKPMSTFYTPEDVARGRPAELLGIAKAQGRVEDEGWRIRKNGERFWADVVITALRDDAGVLKGYGKVTRDLTERKAAQDALGQLSGKLLKVQDDERRIMAAELHDNTSPLLTSLVAKLYLAREQTHAEDGRMQRVLDESLALAESTANMVRTVSWLLQPPELEERGLLGSLRMYLDAFAERTGVPVQTQLPDLMPRLPAEHERVMFRLAQDWLENRHRESRLKSAMVRLTMSSAHVELGMRGEPAVGLRPAGQLSVLITAHRERVRQLGGQVAMDPASGALSASLPVRNPGRAGPAPERSPAGS